MTVIYGTWNTDQAQYEKSVVEVMGNTGHHMHNKHFQNSSFFHIIALDMCLTVISFQYVPVFNIFYFPRVLNI